jgi:hypothetical protein
MKILGRAIAQTVSRRLSTAATRVRDRVWSYGIYGGESGTGTGFLRVLRFRLSIFIPPIAPQSPSSIVWGWYNRPVIGCSTIWTQSRRTKKNKKNNYINNNNGNVETITWQIGKRYTEIAVKN